MPEANGRLSMLDLEDFAKGVVNGIFVAKAGYATKLVTRVSLLNESAVYHIHQERWTLLIYQ